MCLMLLSSTEKKKVKSGTITDKALLRRAPRPNQVPPKKAKTKSYKEKRIYWKSFQRNILINI